MRSGRSGFATFLVVLGFLAAVAAMIWGAVGFYARDVPMLGGLLVGGAALVWIGSKLEPDDPGEPPQISPAPAAAPEAVAAPPAPTAQDALVDHTVALGRPVGEAFGWVVVLPDGSEASLVSPTFVGRDPAPGAGRPDVRVLAVPGDSRSVSKTHAVIEPRGVDLLVTDLHSTNGSKIEQGGQIATECSPGVECSVPNGATIALGDYRVRVERRRTGHLHGA